MCKILAVNLRFSLGNFPNYAYYVRNLCKFDYETMYLMSPSCLFLLQIVINLRFSLCSCPNYACQVRSLCNLILPPCILNHIHVFFGCRLHPLLLLLQPVHLLASLSLLTMTLVSVDKTTV